MSPAAPTSFVSKTTVADRDNKHFPTKLTKSRSDLIQRIRLLDMNTTCEYSVMSKIKQLMMFVTGEPVM